jgi:hypothetical protein
MRRDLRVQGVDHVRVHAERWCEHEAYVGKLRARAGNRDREVVLQVRAAEQQERCDHHLDVLGRRCQQRILEQRMRQLDVSVTNGRGRAVRRIGSAQRLEISVRRSLAAPVTHDQHASLGLLHARHLDLSQ